MIRVFERIKRGGEKKRTLRGTHMQFLLQFCFLVVVCSAFELHKIILQVFLWLFLMDFASCLKLLTRSSEFKGGFLLLGCFSPAFNIFGLFLVFGLGLKLLKFTWQGKGLIPFLCEIRGKSGYKKCGFCLKKGFDKVCYSKMMSFRCSSLKLLGNSKSRNKDDLLVSKEPPNPNGVAVVDYYKSEREWDDDDDDERKCCVEDEEFDAIALRRLVKKERHRADMVYTELEKERMASASAADEAMAMILRLQSEKSSMEIEANQQRRLAERKLEYDQEMIESLQWILMKHESERTVLEEKLRWCEEKLKQYMKSGEVDQFQGSYASSSFDVESAMEEGFVDVQTDLVEEDFALLYTQSLTEH
ncbi:hypothetical protein P3X46_013579 [Hevea brasiliensis]|uniref:GTD-binding domain-containing protein n=1 Tax=Hevea brasiliensis TaxID=3981 RepID=A0ABQ9M3Z8_HEVBR|nr:protein FLOURY 1-like isoform X1 [Hevea brasiliensis]KAJ9174992.1 hypothetical protein P3X46_013579 [Hevea brasiliensis]